MPNLLLEIGTEEIPAGYIKGALEQIAGPLESGIAEARLSCEDIRTTGTPRRLVAFVEGLPEHQPDVTEEVQGPPARIAFDDDGNPTKAATGFAKKLGIDPSELEQRETNKGVYAFGTRHEPGKPTAKVLEGLLPEIITGIRFPKSMRWVPGGITFARPFRSILALLDDEVVPFELNGVASGRVSRGHPFLAPEDIETPTADLAAFTKALADRYVILDIDRRRELIREKINRVLKEHGSELDNEELLAEVNQLVEWPNIVVGRFDPLHLEVLPDEVTVAAMAEHQRYFHVRDADGKLQPEFISVSNRLDEHADTVRDGNERVLAARLADAEFFWHEDTETPLADKLPRLKTVVFQEKLGTYYDKAERMTRLAGHIGAAMGLDTGPCRRGAKLCKADLVTQMVKEFPKLQGIMGRRYARHDGLDEPLAVAIAQHYQPRGATDSPPDSPLGACLALADKLDSLTACFCAGLAPTGNRDPYALRRHALGIIRIILETNHAIQLDLPEAVAFAKQPLPDDLEETDGAEQRILDFVADRLRVYMIDKGRRYDLFDAVIDAGINDLKDFVARLDQLQEISRQSGWDELVTVVQRTANILKKETPEGRVDPELFEQDEEKTVWRLLEEHQDRIGRLVGEGDYIGASRAYADAFVAPVHEFFDKVFVNVDDGAVKNNRLLLMKRINEVYSQNIADLSRVVTDEAE